MIINRLATCCLFLSLILNHSTHAAAPNVVVFLADDLGYGEVGCYGQKHIKTPHIDQLAAEGMRFTDFYAGNAVCAPSRCCLLTGKHAGQAYVRNNGDPKDLQFLAPRYGWEFPGQNPLPDSEITIAETLQAQGYATAAIGKWGLGHFGTSGDPNRQGFDLFYGFNCQRHAHNHYPRFLWRNGKKETLPGNDRQLNGETYSQDKFTEVAIEFLRENREQPFFLFMPFAIPHLSIQVPDASLAEYRGNIPEADYDHKGYLTHPAPRAGYAAMVSHLDRDIGRIMTELRRLGLEENTLVLFTSDNGPTYDRLGGSDSDFFNSSAGLRGRKGSLYEGGIRVPMIARWPNKIAAGSTSSRPAAFDDIFPTIASVADAKTPRAITGTNLANEMTGQPSADSADRYLYWEFPAYGGQQAIRQGKWKAIRQNLSRLSKRSELNTELYDLSVDPQETQNLATKFPAVLKKLTDLMHVARTPSNRFAFPILDAQARDDSRRPGINKNFVAPDLQVQEWIEKFEVESREVFLARNNIVDAMQLMPGHVVADVGAGTGLFSFLFSERVQASGHVLATDISRSFLKHIDAEATRKQVSNVTTIRCREDSVALSADSLDFAFICDTYHHFEFPTATMSSLHSALKPGGTLIVIDFDRVPGKSRDWIVNHVRADKQTFRSEIESVGFRFVREESIEGLDENYFLRFTKR